jgi:uncharacterized membrane protein YhaH (DUF805 family)
MSFSDAIKSFFANYANFSGRARRSEYWFASLFAFIVNLPLVVLSSIADQGQVGIFTLMQLGWTVAIIVPSLAVASRRLHDTGKSFGYYFLILIPLVGAILVLIELLKDSAPGPNKYGNPVK